MRGARKVLLIQPDAEGAEALEAALAGLGATCRVAADAEAGWRAFASEPPDVVLTTLTTPRRDGAWLLRRMRDEYLGQLPPVFALAQEPEITDAIRELDFDGILVAPVAQEALVAVVAGTAAEESPARQASRLRELFDLSLLSGDLDATLKSFVDRVCLAFRASDCVLWGPPHEERWPKTRRPLGGSDDQALLLWRCDLAVTSNTTVLIADSPGPPGLPVVSSAARSFVAASLEAPGARSLGALCLVHDGPRTFTPDERDALRMLARRVALELAWRSAHDRLAQDHDRLRETAHLDPLLGIWTRAALEEAIASELARAQRSGEPLAVAIIDVEQLRQLNDRHGHVVGDAALVHLTNVVRCALGPEDLVGRYSGDELGVLLVGAPPDQLHARLETIRRAVSQAPLLHHGLELQLRVKIGATRIAPNEATGDEAFARAGAALRQAKRARVPVQIVEPDQNYAGTSTTGAHEVADDFGAPDLLPAGTTLGGMYQILHEISRGAMGVVYRAEDLGLGRPVAVKVLRPDLARDAELVARFREEAAMLASLRHENLVQVYAFGAQGDDVYFVMELVEGEALSDVLARADEAGEPLDVATIGSIVAQVSEALHAMHRAGAVHRDVKPANILLDRVRERAVLVDVGVAKRTGSAADAAGTPGFAAPESFTAGTETQATDVYGLAATAYMMLTGLAPFGGGDVARVIRRQLHDTPAAPSSLRPELSPAVDVVLGRALSPKPEARYGSAIEFSRALREALAQPAESATAARRTLVPGTLAHGSGRRPVVEGAELPMTTRRLARALELAQEVAPAPTSFGSARGALFRVAYRILGNRLGSSWIRGACEHDPGLAEVLRPSVAPLGWYPIERLIALLHAVPAQVRDPRKVARELGRATMSHTFARFFGADPSSLSPAEVLGAATTFWSRFHTWGQIGVEQGDGTTTISIADTPRDPLVCHMVEGAFERIAELAGALSAQALHTACETEGAPVCTFEIRWGSSN